MASSADERAFLRAIRAEPHDDALRLIYADWLDERGDPRGEFIRIQCALAKLPINDPLQAELTSREQTLRDEHEVEWSRPLHGLVSGWEFVRGILESVSLSAGAFLEHAVEIVRRAPVRRFRIFEAGTCFAQLVRSSRLGLARELDLCGNDLGNGGINLLIRSPHLSRVHSLDLSFNGISDTGLLVLGTAENLPGLRELSLNDNGPFGRRGMAALAESPDLRGLHVLDLSGCGLDANALGGLLIPGAFPRLRWLGLQADRLGDDGAVLLSRTPMFERLLRQTGQLDLSENEIGPIGTRALATCPALVHVRTCDLSGNLLGDEGVDILLDSPYLRSLTELTLRGNRIGDAGGIRIAESELLRQLSHLDLTDNALSATGLDAIRQSPHLDWRATVDLPEATEWTPRSSRPINALRRRSRRRRGPS